ncbi:MAG: xylulokinase [Caldilineaceae bacterium]|nr:xylulokinase [Caldilineaceae bacterium]
MNDPLLLGVDLGTSSVKVIAVTPRGRIVASGSAEYPIFHPQPTYSEQRPDDWWRAVCATVRSVTGELAADRIAAIGLSGQMHGTVLLDEENGLLGDAVIWPDRRSSRQVDEITRRMGKARLIEIAGSPVATGFQAATVAWLQEEEPDRWARTAKILLPKDYLRWRMTGRFAGDPSDGSGALLLDVAARDWSPVLLDALAIDPRRLPPVQPSVSIAGELQPDAATALGLPAGLPVMTGAADTACSALGAGAVRPGTLLLTLSTGGQLVLPVAHPIVDPAGRIHTFCSAFEPDNGMGYAGWYQMGAILSAGMALRWLRDNVFVLSGGGAYTRMSAWAGESPPGSNGLIFLPYLAGERTPHMDPLARGAFLGLTLSHGRSDMVRAVMEGVTFALANALAVLTELGAHPAEIVLAGGGASSPLWRQIVADVFGLPVRPLQVAEQSAVGAALPAGLGAGLVEAASFADEWVSYGEVVQPNPATQRFYAGWIEHFRAGYVNNRGLFAALGRA